MTIATSYEQLANGSPDGSQWGRSASEKIGFFGTTPQHRPAVTYNATLTATVVPVQGTNGFGFSTSADYVSLLGAVKDIQHVLTLFGMWE